VYLKEHVVSQCVNYVVNYKLLPVEWVSAAERFLECVLQFVVECLGEDHLRLSEAFRAVMDPSRSLYEYNNHSTDAHAYVVSLCIYK
jgi:hypothetical protein